MARARAGDEAAFAVLVRDHWRRVYGHVRRRLDSDADAQEVTQDTFVRMHRALPRFRGECALSTWLYRIALNLSVNRRAYWRTRRREFTVELEEAGALASPSQNPREAAMTNELEGDVRLAAAQMEGWERSMLRLRNERRLTYRQIADELGVPVGTVKSRICRARHRLRRLIPPR